MLKTFHRGRHLIWYDDILRDTRQLLKVINELSDADLGQFIEGALLVRARRRAPALPSEETALLLEINQGIPTDLRDRYQGLLEKRDEGALTDAEYAELLESNEQIEAIGVKRIEALAELATIRQVPLLKLMEDLGIQSPGVRS
ncbi:hypothetical protein [Leptolyngbya sp. NIES-2104]|uniref:hypothetical protein n=1 Tax=Leptolyngbya sp. NIES-2104 TaxID=1552121 RepID=UPI0006ECBB3E|nr:hypothetical protein [Leptolyngbya sp. NIES-2104]GAQ00077.1 hypothetical protein NIES2104_66420 [Leptolyngbya sp. NIES-2104]